MMSSLDLQVVQEAWARYVAGPEPIPAHIEGVRQEIVDSWRNAKGKVDPFAPNQTIPAEQFNKIVQDNAPLIQIARPYLQNLFQYLRETGHQITIVDRNGCILDTIFDDSLPQETPLQFRISNGTLFSEETAGTNGIALCLTLHKPVVVWGPEHFQKNNHGNICYTAPLYDQFNKLIGFVDISGPLEHYQPSALAMLQSSVRGIEREFSFRQTNAVLTAALDAFSEGILVLNADKIIIHHNLKASEVLRVGADTLIGQSIYAVLRQDSLPASAQSFQQKIAAMECTILNRYHTLLDVSLTVIPSCDRNGLNTTLIKVEAQAERAHVTYRGNEYAAHYTFDSVLGDSPAVQSVKAMGMIAATTAIPVLIFGESGTGKDVVAQAIHNSSACAGGPFVSLDCSKIPRGLLESELFGYEGGVFCGGKENGHTGKFEQANGGTLFLDEVNCLPQDAQEALVRVLQTGSVTRLGGKYAKSVAFKLIVATTVNLLSLVQRKTFRADLYYALNALTITLPPLRERKQDILPTVHHFIERHIFESGKPAVSFDAEVSDALLNYSWPNNTREVEAVMEETLHIAEGPVIQLSDLPTSLLSSYYENKARRGQEKDEGSQTELTQMEKESGPLPTHQTKANLGDYQRILDELRAHGGDVKQTAKALNMPLSTLYRKLNKYGLDPKHYKKKAD